MSDIERVERVLSEYDREASRYERLCENVERLLKELLRTSEILFSQVTSRVKQRDKFEGKIKDAKKYESARNVTDIAGARVITYFEDDVDRVAAIIRGRDDFEIDVQNSVDKRRALQADQFGYQSLHLVVSLSKKRIGLRENRDFEGLKIEIQVRSLLQHTWAEIEHRLGYKTESYVPASIRRRFSRIAGLLELADQEFVTVRKEAGAVTKDLPVCRAEGMTELVPEFPIDFPYTALPADSDLATKSLFLHVNTNITNLIFESNATEVTMFVEEGGALVRIAKGVLVGVNTLQFANVLPMAPSSKRGLIRILFSGLRVNALQLGVATTLAPITIQATIAVRKKKDDTYHSATLRGPVDIARVMSSMDFRGCAVGRPTDVLPVSLSKPELPKDITVRFTYAPQFTDAFRPSNRERSSSEMAVVQGTRLALWISNVPADVRVFVTVCNLPDTSDQVCFQLTESNLVGDGPFRAIAGSSNRSIDGLDAEFSEVKVQFTTAVAVWECTETLQPHDLPSFGVVIAIPASAQAGVMTALGALVVTGSIATADSDASVPRFGSVHQNPISIIDLN